MENLKGQQDRMKQLLFDAVTLLVKSGIPFKKELNIKGLLAITVDGNSIFLVDFNENYLNENSYAAVEIPPSGGGTEINDHQEEPPQACEIKAETVVLDIIDSEDEDEDVKPNEFDSMVPIYHYPPELTGQYKSPTTNGCTSDVQDTAGGVYMDVDTPSHEASDPYIFADDNKNSSITTQMIPDVKEGSNELKVRNDKVIAGRGRGRPRKRPLTKLNMQRSPEQATPTRKSRDSAEHRFSLRRARQRQARERRCVENHRLSEQRTGGRLKNRRVRRTVKKRFLGCGICDGCIKVDNCGTCIYCKDRLSLGGKNTLRQKCILRQCHERRKALKKAVRSADTSESEMTENHVL